MMGGEGQTILPKYVLFDWADAYKSTDSTQYQSWRWALPRGLLEDYHYCTLESVSYSQSNFTATPLYLALAVSELGGKNFDSTHPEQNLPVTWLVPNITTDPQLQSWNNSGSNEYVVDVQDKSIQQFTFTFGDQTLTRLTPIMSPTGFYFYMMCKFWN